MISILIFLTQIASAQQLDIQIGDKVQKFELSLLKTKLKSQSVTNIDPVYKTKKTFVGFKLKDLLELVGPIPTELDEVSFVAIDGYAPSIGVSDLATQSGLIAYREAARESGFPSTVSNGKKITFEPFYLVWENEKSVPEHFPRPYQLTKIAFTKFTEKFKSIYPKEVESDEESKRGFTLYRGLCFRCHSVNGIGGTLGPELNAPNNILEYWNKTALKNFIKNPSGFRANSKMPQLSLSDKDIDDILEYFDKMKSHKNVTAN